MPVDKTQGILSFCQTNLVGGTLGEKRAGYEKSQ